MARHARTRGTLAAEAEAELKEVEAPTAPQLCEQAEFRGALRNWVLGLQHQTTVPDDEPGQLADGSAQAVVRIPAEMSLLFAGIKPTGLETQNQTGTNSDVPIVDDALGHPVNLGDTPSQYAVTKIHAAANHGFEVIRHNPG